jgi:putative ABC transport system ATP-binding protein
MSDVVQVKRMSKVYRMGAEEVYALNDVSLDIDRGELVAIVGSSGCGKSTFLHVIGCLQRPTSGQVLVEGKDVTRLSNRELAQVRGQKIGFVFQAFNLLPNESALQNVELPLEYQGVPYRERRRLAQKALEIVELGERVDHRPNELSGGQRQRVAIARALVHNPAIILADEPTGALDSRSTTGVMALFQRLNEQGRTVVIVTHDATVASHCQRMVTLSDGRVVDIKELSPKPAAIPPEGREVTVEAPAVKVLVCPRCNSDNAPDRESCYSCGFSLGLTDQEENLLRQRLSGAWPGLMGVESPSEEADFGWQGSVEELRKIALFANLGPKNLTKLIPALEERRYPGGATIINQGDPGDSFYVLRQGAVQIVVGRGRGEPAVVAELRPGEGFGEMALLTGQPRSATVVASTDVLVWCLSRETFEALLTENLSLAFYFNRILSQRLQDLQERLLS